MAGSAEITELFGSASGWQRVGGMDPTLCSARRWASGFIAISIVLAPVLPVGLGLTCVLAFGEWGYLLGAGLGFVAWLDLFLRSVELCPTVPSRRLDCATSMRPRCFGPRAVAARRT